MKKTIAKIMAAAMVLSTVVAPNVNATTTYTAAVAANASVLPINSLTLTQTAKNTNPNSSDILMRGVGSDTGTLYSRSNPLDIGFAGTPHTDATGNIDYVDTDLNLTATAPQLNGDLIYFDAGTGIVIASSVATEYVGSVTAVAVSDNAGYTGKALDIESDTDVRAAIAEEFGVKDTYASSPEKYAAAVIEAIKSSNTTMSNVTNIVTGQKSGAYVYNNKVTTSADSLFKVDQYIGSDVFDGGYQIMSDGHFRLLVQDPNSTKTAQITSALNGVNPIVLKIRMTFPNAVMFSGTATHVGAREVWLRLTDTDESDYDGYVLLKKDNAEYTHVGVNYVTDASGYAEITQANTALLKSDVVKGGRLLLDYVYNRTNTNADINSTKAFKIRQIDSRVFKDGKFQAISGLGDDGAKWIRNIHNGAFRSCKQLKKVNLDTSKKIRKINAKAFYDCKKLATVKMDGRNLKQIGSKAFGNTKSNITFKIKGNASQFKKAKAKIAKQAPKKAKFSRL